MLQIIDCEQGTPEWYESRRGIPTASEFECLVKRGKDGKPSATRRTYLLQLAGVVLTGELPENFTSVYTERGKRLEAEARDLYAMLADAEPVQVGFIRNGEKGCSPDSLVGAAGMLEIKTKKPALLIDAILADKFLEEHRAQCQGALWVAEREWIDLACYWPGLPPVIHRAYRDEPYIAALSDAVDAFNEELAQIVERVRAYGQPIATEEAA
jgi:hypothetical protein